MTKEEAKRLSDVLKAYSDGKTIQVRFFHNKFPSGWTDWEDADLDKYAFSSMNDTEWRIKPELKLRPYANVQEFLKDQKEHGPYLYVHNNSKDLCLPIMFPNSTNSFWYLWKDYTDNELKWQNSCFKLLDGKWQDGTPCGIKK